MTVPTESVRNLAVDYTVDATDIENPTLVCIDEANEKQAAPVRPLIAPFHSLYSPTKMRQLALVAHNHMKPAMHDFIIQYGEILRKFRVTGTETTMSICMREWKDKEGVSSFLAETTDRLDLVASKGDRLFSTPTNLPFDASFRLSMERPARVAPLEATQRYPRHLFAAT